MFVDSVCVGVATGGSCVVSVVTSMISSGDAKNSASG